MGIVADARKGREEQATCKRLMNMVSLLGYRLEQKTLNDDDKVVLERARKLLSELEAE